MNLFHRWYCNSNGWANALQRWIIPGTLGDADLGEDVLEIGPGPGLTTDWLRSRVARLTSIEIDDRLAKSLERRMEGTNVTVVAGDATDMPFPDASFSGAVCFTMLHHVPSSELQDRLLARRAASSGPAPSFSARTARPACAGGSTTCSIPAWRSTRRPSARGSSPPASPRWKSTGSGSTTRSASGRASRGSAQEGATDGQPEAEQARRRR